MPGVHPDEAKVRALALSFPEAHEDFPWGHSAIKVKGKAFLFLSKNEPSLSLSVKLPFSAYGALQLPFCEPTHYGLGRAGWVTATYPPGKRADLAAVRSWIEESFAAVAPKRLAKARTLAAQEGKPPPRRAPVRVRGAAARPGARRAGKSTRSRRPGG
jgi:predicted DNA-binding protein (MmcQ/YjbR family)